MHRATTYLEEVEWFPVAIDADRDALAFAPVTRWGLQATPFHDGRSPLFELSRGQWLPLQQALDWFGERRPARPPLRLIAHTSFCGSTLLARLLADGGHCASYREPQVLAELANLQAAGHALSRDRERWRRLLALVFDQFSLFWPGQRGALLKPSNWVNALLPELAAVSELRAVHLSSDIQSYLCANLRGGKPRLAYSLQLLNQFASRDFSVRNAIAAIEAMRLPAMDRTLHLLALCLQAQHRLLDESRALSHLALPMSRDELMSAPAQAVSRAARTLDLAAPEAGAAALQAAASQHAKSDRDVAYSAREESSRNAWIRREYRRELAAACDWYHDAREVALTRSPGDENRTSLSWRPS